MIYEKCYGISAHIYWFGKIFKMIFSKCERLSTYLLILMIGTGILFPNTSSAIILIKDAEIENSLQIIANPIYKAD